MITFNGKTQSTKAWAEEMGITYVSLRSRLSLGWSIERALATPTRYRKGSKGVRGSKGILAENGIKKGRRERGDCVKNRRFTVLEATEQRDGDSIVYVCRCNNCGSEVMVPSHKLQDARTSRPGYSLYGTWFQMIERCENIRNVAYRFYGAKGVKVCERWKRSFSDFLIDVGQKPSLKHSLDRIDTKGNYEPENCRWATNKQQARNRSDNIMIEYQDKIQCLAAWSEESGIAYNVLYSRYHSGWSAERMMTTEVRIKKKVTRPILTSFAH